MPQITYESVVSQLESAGYKNIKKISGVKLAVLVTGNRVATLEEINSVLKGSKYDPTPSSESSVGKVVYGSISVLAKPASRQGTASAGVDNELALVKQINHYAKSGPINVVFQGKNKKFSIDGCTSAQSVGSDTAGRKKADIMLVDYKGKQYPISLKQDDAETWESADTFFGSGVIKSVIDRAVKDGKTQLIAQETYFTIEPNIAFAANSAEKKKVVFGSDLLPAGAVVTKTFMSSDFKMKDDTLTVNVSNIITRLSDVTGDKDVYFLIRNDKTRKAVREYPGIRVLAAYKKRINKNVVVVQR